MAGAHAASRGSSGLEHGAIGLREVMFQSITSMAPAGAVALSIAAGATYAAESIHPAVGFLVGWGYALVEALIGPITMILFGYIVSSVTQTEFGWPFTTTWVIFMIAASLIIAALNYRGVKLSARTGTVLGTIEIIVFLVLAVWLIIKAGSSNTGSVLTLHYATIKGYHGFSGVVAGSIYTILAFIGFEASAPLAEEARNPRRTIQIAVVTSCLVIGIFYVITTYAGDVFFGPNRYVSFGALGGGSPWIQLARDVWGVGWVIAFLAILNSTFANGNAGTLATTRTWFAMARIGMLPAPLARTHRKWKSPSTGVVVQLLVTLAIGLPVGIHFGPTTAFVFLATILTAVMIAIYMIFNLSCLLYYARKARSEFNWLLHAVIPVLGIAAFLPAWFTAMGIGGSVLKFVSPLKYPSSETGLAIGIWYLIGVVVLIYLYRRHPSRLPELRRVFAEEEPAAVLAGQS